jgi:exopolysaccharide biosynthesis WecB/TagA/CpsF family protein
MIDVVTHGDLVRAMHSNVLNARRSGRPSLPRLVFSVNGQAVSMYHRNADFRAMFDQADVLHADGMSVVRAARWLTKRGLPERVATSDLFHHAARMAASCGISFFLLGGTEATLCRAAERIRARYPTLDLRGWRAGYFADEDTKDVLREIRAAQPDILWVGLGRPKQEAFCVRHRDALRGVTWLKTCGGLFKFLSGEMVRAPPWIQSLGLEWAHRLALEPKRLWWRYASTNVDSIWLMARHTADES